MMIILVKKTGTYPMDSCKLQGIWIVSVITGAAVAVIHGVIVNLTNERFQLPPMITNAHIIAANLETAVKLYCPANGLSLSPMIVNAHIIVGLCYDSCVYRISTM